MNLISDFKKAVKLNGFQYNPEDVQIDAGAENFNKISEGLSEVNERSKRRH